MKIHVTGNTDHAAFNHQHIIPQRRYIPGYIAGAGHIADDRAGFQIGRVNDEINRTGHRYDHIRFMQAGLDIRTHRKRRGAVSVQFLCQFFQRADAPGNEIDMTHLAGQDTGTGRTDGTAGSDDSHFRIPQVFPHETGRFPCSFQGRRNRIAVTGRNRNI